MPEQQISTSAQAATDATVRDDDDDLVELVEDDDLLQVVEDDGVGADRTDPEEVWTILVVDDDREVHDSTDFALADVEMLGHPLRLLHAYSAEEGAAVLAANPDVAAILLDVVMETEDAGLRLAKRIREEMRLANVRIILRTGQPGKAPELSVIRDYDINDYRTKSELTRVRLLTSLHAALRSYSQILALDANRRGLQKIIQSSHSLFAQRELINFCEGVLIQLGSLIEVPMAGIVIARKALSVDDGPDTLAEATVVAASGPYRTLAGCRLSDLKDARLRSLIGSVLDERQTVHLPDASVLHVGAASGDNLAIFLDTGRHLGDLERSLLEVFATNIALGFDNAAIIEDIRTVAYVDPLTGLGTRSRFALNLAERLVRNRAEGRTERLAVILLDLDHFQIINDGLGHETGDWVLRTVAHALFDRFENAAAPARFAGDCFAVMVPAPADAELTARLDALFGIFAEPILVQGNRLSVSATIGYAFVDDVECDEPGKVEGVLRAANIALKRAKAGLRGTAVGFDPSLAKAVHQRVALVSRISDALRENHFFLTYQPQFRLSDGALAGAEALLRWRCADGTLVSPGDFIPAAEDSGHIVALGEMVLERALADFRDWRRAGIAPARVAVNVSLRQLRERGFLATVARIVEAGGVEPSRIELEITESTAMEGAGVLAAVEALDRMGFRIAIDDFGTGYSSLARLQRLPVSVLKIDRCFVMHLSEDERARETVKAIIRLGHVFGLTVLAEGIETVEQQRLLATFGCHEGQGFLFARPIPAAETTAFLRAAEHVSRQH